MFEGEMPLVSGGTLYGDGTGHHQKVVTCRTSAWSLVRLDETAPLSTRPAAVIRGTVGGWEQTVPRAELTALIAFLRHSTSSTSYVGDCRYVLEGAERGVRPFLMSSAAADPDLWRVVNLLIRDHGSPPSVIKVRAHRSRTLASQEGEEALLHWHGNGLADAAAKSLNRRRMITDDRMQTLEATEDFSLKTIICVARGAAMAVSKWPQGPHMSLKRARPGNHIDVLGDSEDVHIIRCDGEGRFVCVICRRLAYTAAGARRMAVTICGGAIGNAVHQSHNISRSHGLVWCRCCGAFSSRWPRQLTLACPRRPRSEAQRNVLRRLMQGMTPTTATYFDEVTRTSGRPRGTVDVIEHLSDWDTKGQLRHHADARQRVLPPSAEPPRPDSVGPPRVDPRPQLGGLPPGPPRVGVDLRARSAVDACRDANRLTAACRPHRYFRLDRGGSDGAALPNDNVDASSSSSRAPPSAASAEDHASLPRPRVEETAKPCARDSGRHHWSSAVAIGGPKFITQCAVCDGRTRLRCRQCLNGICLACLKAGKPCRPTAVDQASQHSADGRPSAELVPPRRRLRGKQPVATNDNFQLGHRRYQLADVTRLATSASDGGLSDVHSC
jgi:hypothetical protein